MPNIFKSKRGPQPRQMTMDDIVALFETFPNTQTTVRKLKKLWNFRRNPARFNLRLTCMLESGLFIELNDQTSAWGHAKSPHYISLLLPAYSQWLANGRKHQPKPHEEFLVIMS